jgi:hypothetical protein
MKQFTESDIRKWKSSVDGSDMYSLYITDTADLVDAPLDWQKRGLQQTASGYGSKLTSQYKIDFEGKLYRLYVTQFSNAGSTWFRVHGRKVFVN